MRKNFCSIIFCFLSLWISAQNGIPNGNFESWNSMTFDAPSNYPSISNPEAFAKCGVTTPNTVKSTDAFHGAFSVQMTTVSSATDTCFGYFINTIPNNDFPNWTGGFPYTEMPTGIRGYYKSSIAPPDTGRVLLIFKQGGAPIEVYTFPLYGNQNAWTLFNFPISLPSNPDTVIFAAASSDFSNEILILPGSMLQLDSLSFTGVANQPVLLNGDFENWTAHTLYSPEDWGQQQAESEYIRRTNDNAAGSYAIELETFLGDNNGTPEAQGAQINMGWWDNSCACYKGGYPFSNQIDTLVFSYKYNPMNNDSAEINLTFKKNGGQIGGTSIKLSASTSYQVKEFPFNLGQAPDTVIIQVQSSLWQHNALSYVGSVLKIDEIHFKSQPLNTAVPVRSLANKISVFPNPSNGVFKVQNAGFNADIAEIYNTMGEKVYTKTLNSDSETLNLSHLPNGIYFLQLTLEETVTKKIMINK